MLPCYHAKINSHLIILVGQNPRFKMTQIHQLGPIVIVNELIVHAGDHRLLLMMALSALRACAGFGGGATRVHLRVGGGRRLGERREAGEKRRGSGGRSGTGNHVQLVQQLVDLTLKLGEQKLLLGEESVRNKQIDTRVSNLRLFEICLEVSVLK